MGLYGRLGDGPSQKSQYSSPNSLGGSASGGEPKPGIEVVVVPDLHLGDLAQAARLDHLGGLLIVGPAPLLGADLHDAVVLAGGLDRGRPSPIEVRQRFLDVDVLARLAGVDRAQAVPVVVGGHDHRVDVLVVQQLPVVAVGGDGVVAGRLHALAEPLLIQIADGDDPRARALHVALHHAPSFAAAADQSEVDRAVGAGGRGAAGRTSLAGRCGGRRRSSGAEIRVE